LFFMGLALLVIALAVPPKPGQTLKERTRSLARHFPFFGWLRRRD
jgi:hypothetical protein